MGKQHMAAAVVAAAAGGGEVVWSPLGLARQKIWWCVLACRVM